MLMQGLISLALGAAAAAHAFAPVAAQPEVTGNDILNFALNLECLEAEFYSWAAFGEGLSEEDRGGGPPSVGGKKADLEALSKARSAAGAAYEL